MELPFEIRNYIENELNNKNIQILKENSKNISISYRENKRDGRRMLSKESEAIAYAIARMPATFGAVSSALEKTLEIYNPEINSVADIGAGTGTASIAVKELIDVDEIECFEREDAMIEIGKQIFHNYGDIENKVRWNKVDITSSLINKKYDLVVSSYMINEIKDEIFNNIIERIWKLSNDMILIVEPGTVQGYKNIMMAKEKLISLGGRIIAPCMTERCLLPKDDWCNFYCRVQRTKIHKDLKLGNSPFEDEKFMYVAVSKKSTKNNKSYNRIIRHPLVYSGYVKLKVCGRDGIEEITITKKDKDKYKIVKKAKHGDIL